MIDSIEGAGGKSTVCPFFQTIAPNRFDVEPDWVTSQTRERLMRELELEDTTYEERLADARKREEILRKMSQARVIKKAVSLNMHVAVTSTEI